MYLKATGLCEAAPHGYCQFCPNSYIQHFLPTLRYNLLQQAHEALYLFFIKHHFIFAGVKKSPPLTYEGREEFLSVPEMELLFGFPLHYTDCDNLATSCRRQLLGRSWCTPVIADILKPLQSIFKLRDATERCAKHYFVQCHDPSCRKYTPLP